MAPELPSASLVENVRLNSQVFVPNALRGIFRPRATAVAAATKADVDRWALGLLEGIRRSHAPGPVWVRVVKDKALLLLSREDIRRVLEGSPDPFAPDPEAKRKGMSHFQPDALTISRDGEWENRRAFAEAVLDTRRAHHRLAERFAAVARAGESSALLEAGGGLERARLRRLAPRLPAHHAAHGPRRLRPRRRGAVRPAGRDDGRGQRAPGQAVGALRRIRRRSRGLRRPRGGGEPRRPLRRRAARRGDESPAQLIHWLFAMQDTVAANSLRALALIAAHPRQRAAVESEIVAAGKAGTGALPYTAACFEEAMRLFPTTPLLSRETIADIDWDGDTVPAGTQILISNLANHRDRASHDYADHFTPEAWTQRTAGSDWTFNHFSHGPQGCPGAGIAVALGSNLIASLLSRRVVRLRSPSLDPSSPLPYMLDFFALRLDLVLAPPPP